MRVLCTGDLHIGRRASKIPHDIDGSMFASSAGWGAIVDAAIHYAVDVVAISGDLVDRDNRFFEALGPLERGLRRLTEHGIDTVAVTGNHDYDVLPRIAEQIDGGWRFHLLGHAGNWERHTILRDGVAVLHVDGWSFTSEHCRENPLDQYVCADGKGVPILGLVHGDLDQPTSDYAPLRLTDFTRHDVAFWLIGHVHHPKTYRLDSGHIVLYPGSPYAMDPGETGAHGPWLLDFASGSSPHLRSLTLSPVRYEGIDVDISGADDLASVEGTVAAALLDAGRKATSSAVGGELLCLCCRLTLTGRTPVHADLVQWRRTIIQDLTRTIEGVTVAVESIEIATRPAIDLEHLTRTNGPVGETARLLSALDSQVDDGPHEDLIAATWQRLQAVHREKWFDGLDDREPRQNDARALLIEQGWSLLSALIAQKEDL